MHRLDQTVPADYIANGFVFGTNDGVTYGSFAEAPNNRIGTVEPIAGSSHYLQSQSFVKRAADARLSFTVTNIQAGIDDYNPPLLTGPRPIVAEAYPIPTDGPVGEMLRASKNHPWRPAHLHFMIKAEGYETLITHVFRDGDRYLDSDAVFGVRQSLVADWVQQADGSWLLEFDFVLNPQKK